MFILKTLLATSVVLISAVVASSSAQAISFTGTTAGEPIWDRPNEGTPPNSLSGTNTSYVSTQFTVDTAGLYDFLSTTTTTWDNFTFLYSNSFNPNTPLANVIIGNDDVITNSRSGFGGINLTTGTNYFFVTTGFDDSQFGSFNNSITGVGNVTLGATAVPFEFSPTLGLSALGGLWLGKSLIKKVKANKDKTLV